MSFDRAKTSRAQTRCVGASPRNSLVSAAKSGSSFISCYEALIRACLKERAVTDALGLTRIERRPGAFVGTVNKPQALAANDASGAFTAGLVMREHLDGLGDSFDRAGFTGTLDTRGSAPHAVCNIDGENVRPHVDGLNAFVAQGLRGQHGGAAE